MIKHGLSMCETVITLNKLTLAKLQQCLFYRQGSDQLQQEKVFWRYQTPTLVYILSGMLLDLVFDTEIMALIKRQLIKFRITIHVIMWVGGGGRILT